MRTVIFFVVFGVSFVVAPESYAEEKKLAAKNHGKKALSLQEKLNKNPTGERATKRLDPDGDGINILKGNCPTTSNTDQSDKDQDGIGDACDSVVGIGTLMTGPKEGLAYKNKKEIRVYSSVGPKPQRGLFMDRIHGSLKLKVTVGQLNQFLVANKYAIREASSRGLGLSIAIPPCDSEKQLRAHLKRISDSGLFSSAFLQSIPRHN